MKSVILTKSLMRQNDIVLRNGDPFTMCPTKRYNLSFKPITPLKVNQDFYHPRGLWYALGDEWFDDNCSPYTAKYRYINEIDISRLDILVIDKNNIDCIKNIYGINSLKEIDWYSITKKYDGVEILDEDLVYGSPASWLGRFSYKSGCIWKNQDLIKIVDSKVI